MFFTGKSKLSSESCASIKAPSPEMNKTGQGWLPFSRVFKIFPDLPTKTLCTLVSLTSFKPMDVLAVVPDASSDQLANFFDIVEETISSPKVDLPDAEVKDKEKLVKGDSVKSDVVEPPAGGSKKILQDINVLLPSIKNEKNLTVTFSNDFENKLFQVLGASNPSPVTDADRYKQTYDRLRKKPQDRSRLENIHAARGHRYGIAHLGPKHLYQENPNVAIKLKTQSDRRKFRAGLKGNIDFLNQLNMLDFEECLKAGSSDGLNTLKLQNPGLMSELKNKLNDVPPIEVIKLVNEEKASKILQIFEKISSLAHFSQTMSDYFAQVDSLEPALAVVCQVLRQNENIGALLKDKHTTFLALAQSFQALKSHMDRDFMGNHGRKTCRSTYRRQSSDLEALRRREPSKPYKQRFCHYFQKNSTCRKRNCAFSHICAICKSRRHGEEVCPRKFR